MPPTNIQNLQNLQDLHLQPTSSLLTPTTLPLKPRSSETSSSSSSNNNNNFLKTWNWSEKTPGQKAGCIILLIFLGSVGIFLIGYVVSVVISWVLDFRDPEGREGRVRRRRVRREERKREKLERKRHKMERRRGLEGGGEGEDVDGKEAEVVRLEKEEEAGVVVVKGVGVGDGVV